MKNVLLFWNVLLTVIAGYLLFTHFSSTKEAVSVNKTHSENTSGINKSFRIAYFEMDSIESNFAMVKDVKSELSKKEDAMNLELNSMDKTYRNKVNGYQQQAQTLTQTQSEMATQDLMKLQEDMKSRKQMLDQDYNDFAMRRMKDVKSKIEEFLKE